MKALASEFRGNGAIGGGWEGTASDQQQQHCIGHGGVSAQGVCTRDPTSCGSLAGCGNHGLQDLCFESVSSIKTHRDMFTSSAGRNSERRCLTFKQFFPRVAGGVRCRTRRACRAPIVAPIVRGNANWLGDKCQRGARKMTPRNQLPALFGQQ